MKCPICKIETKLTWGNIGGHLAYAHGRFYRCQFVCFCGKKFKTGGGFIRHLKQLGDYRQTAKHFAEGILSGRSEEHKR